MSPDKNQSRKEPAQQKQGIRHALEGILERLREGLDELTQGLRPQQPQPVPIPIPARRPRRR